ncbi:hypothetical protein ACUNWD_00625 [Sunxiuqinia sp. A32]|uniref:hypothetical protein n=1 Tax=Sunxiuqinia sp. A32 TaxID=3461496 RepID=UPI00404682EB
MRPITHKIYLSIMVIAVFFVVAYLSYSGFSYYQLQLEDRFFHDQHQSLKPSGSWGHGFGIIGSLMMLVGVSLYMLRKRVRRFSRIGVLKYWLEFHIFLCTLGPALVLLHTAFKFGGLVAISFWSMVAVVLSGVIGRYIYLQIPRSIEGRELSLNELDEKKDELHRVLKEKYNLDELVLRKLLDAVKERPDSADKNMAMRFWVKFKFEMALQRRIKYELKTQQLSKENSREIKKILVSEINLNRKIDRLRNMQNLFRYWHVAHLPFALVMLVIMLVHVAVTLVFGYKWIF